MFLLCYFIIYLTDENFYSQFDFQSEQLFEY